MALLTPGADSAPRRAASPGAQKRRISTVCYKYQCMLLLASVMAFGALPGLPTQNPPPGEYDVKAAFLYNFAKFVEWPDSAFSNSESPLIIGVLGEDPFGEVLDRIVAGKLVQGRPLRIRRWKRIEDSSDCHILFVGESERHSLPDIRRRLQSVPVLTVGDWNGFTAGGGMVQFHLRQNRVLFEINDRDAKEAGLKISSRLLVLALRVWE